MEQYGIPETTPSIPNSTLTPPEKFEEPVKKGFLHELSNGQ